MQPFTAVSRFTRKEYLQWTVIRSLRQPLSIILLLGGLYLLISSLLQVAGVLHLYKSPFPILLVGVYLLARPFLTLISAGQHFKTSANLQQGATYTFRDENILISGASLEATLAWAEIQRVQESELYIELFVGKRSAHIIRKEGLSREEIDYIKANAGRQ